MSSMKELLAWAKRHESDPIRDQYVLMAEKLFEYVEKVDSLTAKNESLKKQRDDLWVEDNESLAKIERLTARIDELENAARDYLSGSENSDKLAEALTGDVVLDKPEPHPDHCLCDDCITPEKLAAIPNAAYSGDDLKVCGSCGCSEEDQDHD